MELIIIDFAKAIPRTFIRVKVYYVSLLACLPLLL